MTVTHNLYLSWQVVPHTVRRKIFLENITVNLFLSVRREFIVKSAVLVKCFKAIDGIEVDFDFMLYTLASRSVFTNCRWKPLFLACTCSVYVKMFLKFSILNHNVSAAMLPNFDSGVMLIPLILYSSIKNLFLFGRGLVLWLQSAFPLIT